MDNHRWYKKKQARLQEKKLAVVERRKTPRVICPYCITRAVLVKGDELYPHKPELHEKNFWQCKECYAYVGCHKENRSFGFTGMEPLGKLANAELRSARCMAHKVFDRVWKEKKNTRTFAYLWLSDHMELKVENCHIGMMDLEQCFKVVRLVREQYG